MDESPFDWCSSSRLELKWLQDLKLPWSHASEWCLNTHSHNPPAPAPCWGQCRHWGNPGMTSGHFRQLPLCCCQVSPQYLQGGIFSAIGNPSRISDVEKWEERKGNKSVQQKQSWHFGINSRKSGQSFESGFWSLNLTGSKSSGTILNFFLYNFFP